jgi:hypothetical protein
MVHGNSAEKYLSKKYRAHLVLLVRSILMLGIEHAGRVGRAAGNSGIGRETEMASEEEVEKEALKALGFTEIL